MTVPRISRKSTVVAATCILLLIFYQLQSRPLGSLENGLRPPTFHTDNTPASRELACKTLPGANNTLIILKTGSTELQDKLPIHLDTTLRCYPNYVIFSDLAETFQGYSILDALEDVDPEIKQNHDDFALWRRLQQGGRASLDPSELSGPFSYPQGSTGKPHNPGWKLDKWKFLPMVRKTLELYPDMHWYVFVETDTYIFWSTLLAFLAVKDWTKPHYMGGEINIGDITFAHGGAGYAVSRTGLEMVVEHYVENKKEWETFTAGHWAGDCVLGKAFKDAGSPLAFEWPIWQGDDIGNMNYDRTNNQNRRLWCYPTISYHHLSPTVIRDLWDFEQEWASKHREETLPFLRHSDMYAEYILPRTTLQKSSWDNHGDIDQGSTASPEACRSLCVASDSCVQYTFAKDGKCMTTSRPNLGESSDEEKTSGWMNDRMLGFYENAKSCKDEPVPL